MPIILDFSENLPIFAARNDALFGRRDCPLSNISIQLRHQNRLKYSVRKEVKHNMLSIMSKKESNILKFIIAVVTEFARCYGISQKQAYNYLVRFKGMAHLEEFYNVLHTQSFEDNVEVLAEVCQNNGGQLR